MQVKGLCLCFLFSLPNRRIKFFLFGKFKSRSNKIGFFNSEYWKTVTVLKGNVTYRSITVSVNPFNNEIAVIKREFLTDKVGVINPADWLGLNGSVCPVGSHKNKIPAFSFVWT